MRLPARLSRLLCAAVAGLLPLVAAAQKQTVCTITVNSADEKQAFRRVLPEGKYDFVELVQRNRPDWLASACEAKVSCDILIVSGHHGEGNVFFSDALDRGEYLAAAELERVSCSNSCPGLFANLKEVYLFGCNTLNPQPAHTVSGEVARSYEREGNTPAESARLARVLGQTRGESSRDRMRLVFHDVPAIYGFSSVAPLGPVAGSLLDRLFRSGGAASVGTGRTNSRLLQQFSKNNMVATRGMAAGDPLQGLRKDVCTFADDRMSVAQRLDGVHELLRRPIAESRLLLDRIEHVTATLKPDQRTQPEVERALQRFADDAATRERFMAFARDADELPTRARMLQVAQDLGWLSAQQHRDEIAGLLGQMMSRREVTAPEVDLACTLNSRHELDPLAEKLAAARAGGANDAGHAAVLACLNDDGARGRVLEALASPSDADVQLAQAYLRQRPISDAGELRAVTRAIAGMNAPAAQARALDALARQYLSDPESVDMLKRLFARTPSPSVQNAIAGVLLRADRKSIAGSDLLPTLREHRLRQPAGDTMVDSLIAHLQQPS